MTTDNPSAQDAVEDTTPQCSDPSHSHLDEHEQLVHRLIHEGIDATEQGRLDQARAAFDQALTLAQTHALPLFERSLALFAQSDSARMVVTLSIFLANMLTKTGEPSRSLPILLHARNQAERGRAQGQLSPHEYEYELYGLYRELGRAHQALRQLPQAQTMYQQALHLDARLSAPRERSALYQDILLLHIQRGDLDEARTFGEHTLKRLNPTEPEDLEILADLCFQLGLLSLQIEDYRSSITYGTRAYQYRLKVAPRPLLPDDQAFLGRTFVNVGSGFAGIAGNLSHYVNALAYWRCGQALLEQIEAEDASVPQNNIGGLKQACIQQIGSQAFEQVWNVSEPIYQRLQSALTSRDDGWGPLLTSMMHPASTSTEGTERPTTTQTKRPRLKKRKPQP